MEIYHSFYDNCASELYKDFKDKENPDSPEVVLVCGNPNHVEGKFGGDNWDYNHHYVKRPYSNKLQRVYFRGSSSVSSKGFKCECFDLQIPTDGDEFGNMYAIDMDEKMALIHFKYRKSSDFFFLKRDDDFDLSKFEFVGFPQDLYTPVHLVETESERFLIYELKFDFSYERKCVVTTNEIDPKVITYWKVKDYETYKDGGTTNYYLEDESGNEHKMHIQTPWHRENRIEDVLDDKPIRMVMPDTEREYYKTCVEKIAKIANIKFYKEKEEFKDVD